MSKATELAAKIANDPNTTDPSLSIELILTVVLTIINNCNLNKQDLIKRAQNPTGMDRVMLRVLLYNNGVSRREINAIINRFWQILNTTPTSEIEEAYDELKPILFI